MNHRFFKQIASEMNNMAIEIDAASNNMLHTPYRRGTTEAELESLLESIAVKYLARGVLRNKALFAVDISENGGLHIAIDSAWAMSQYRLW